MSKKITENGSWFANGGNIYSNDFTHDVMLWVTGDFPSPEIKHAYAEEISRRLNEWQERVGDMVIDLEAVCVDSGANLLMGRKAGEAVRNKTKFAELILNRNVVLRVPKEKTVTPSFFIGLLAGSSFVTLKDRVRLEGGTEATYWNFITALQTL